MFNANSANFQLLVYHGENKLHLDEMMIMSVCFAYFGSCMLPLKHIILIVSQAINTAVCSAKNPQQIPILVFGLTRLGLALTICHTQGKCTDAVCENRTDFATTNTDKTIHTLFS